MGHHVCKSCNPVNAPKILRIAFATPEFVTENHFDGGLANYINRVSRTSRSRSRRSRRNTVPERMKINFDHEGVMVHRVMLKPAWHAFNRLTRYSLTTTLHWLNFSTQAYRKLKQLHRQRPVPFDPVSQLLFLRTVLDSVSAHRARRQASSYQPALNDAIGVKRNLDSVMTERLEALQYKLTRNVFTPSIAMQKTLARKPGA